MRDAHRVCKTVNKPFNSASPHDSGIVDARLLAPAVDCWRKP